MAPGNQPLLLVFAHGADLATLTALRHNLGSEPWQTIPELQVPADPIGYTLREGSATESLRDLGIATDRRSLQLRGHRTDEEVIARLGARGMGPAPVTMLELTSVLDRARHCGPPTPAEAATLLGEHLHHAIRNLRAGEWSRLARPVSPTSPTRASRWVSGDNSLARRIRPVQQ